MVKLLLSCDDYIFRHEGKFYFKSQEWCDFYLRYLRIFDLLRIANRVIDEQVLKEGRVLLNNPRIEIHPLPIFHGPVEYAQSYFSVGRAMKSAVHGCDAAILRLPSTIAQRIYKQVHDVGIPFATEIVFDAYDGATTANNLFERALWRIIDFRMRRICAKADGVACVTERHLQRRYYSMKPNHFEAHYSSLSLDKAFFTAPRQFPKRAVMTIAHVDMQISLHGRKGIDIIIQALSKLKKERGLIVNVKFAGDDWDNSTADIMDYAKDHGIDGQVECVGMLSRTALSTFLEEADLFVLPTKAEGLPRVIIESIAKGLPTITTPVSGNPELISSKYLVPFYDVDQLAQKISILVSDKNEYERVSRENFEKSLQYEGTILQTRRDVFYEQLKHKAKSL